MRGGSSRSGTLAEENVARRTHSRPTTRATRRRAMVQGQTTTTESGYTNPDVLVSTEWVAAHTEDPNVRIVESDEDVLLYEVGHIPGAVKIDWHIDQQSQIIRDFVTKEEFEQLLASRGIGNDTTVVFYG